MPAARAALRAAPAAAAGPLAPVQVRRAREGPGDLGDRSACASGSPGGPRGRGMGPGAEARAPRRTPAWPGLAGLSAGAWVGQWPMGARGARRGLGVGPLICE